MQPVSSSFDNQLVALARETRRVAGSIGDVAIKTRLYEIAGEVVELAYLGDRSNKAELSKAMARFAANTDNCPTA